MHVQITNTNTETKNKYKTEIGASTTRYKQIWSSHRKEDVINGIGARTIRYEQTSKQDTSQGAEQG